MIGSKRCLAVALSAAGLCASTHAQVTVRASVDSVGTEANGHSGSPATSTDGRYVAFESSASNLVASDTNGVADVFVRDLQTGTTERVSIATGGAEGNADSHSPSISADGRYVAFYSFATNLVGGDTNAVQDVFVRDRQNNTTERVSLDSGGTQGNLASDYPSISADGRFVAFWSLANNLVPGDTNALRDVFVRDRQSSTTERVSVDSVGTEGNASSGLPSISADGRYVAFNSDASNLIGADTNAATDIFVRDRQSNTTVRVSVATGGVEGNAPSNVSKISANGRYVAFYSLSSNLVAGDTNGIEDVFVRDLQGLTTVRVSVATAGTEGNGVSDGSSISSDGRYVAFRSDASNLVAGDTNGLSDIFVRDLQSGTTERVSIATDGTEENGNGYAPSISGNGRYVVFESDATNLVVGDTNGSFDVFVRDSGAGDTEQESGGTGATPANADSFDASISADDRYVAFESNATNLVTGDVNGSRDIFVRDRQLATTTRVSLDSTAGEANGNSSNPSISADGRYVAFESLASNLVTGDTNGVSDIFVRDLQTGTTTRVSVDSSGTESNGGSFHPSISADGRYVAYDSDATNLVTGDSNLTSDVFLRDRLFVATQRVSVDSGGTQGLGGGSSGPSISGDGRYIAFQSNATNLVASDSNAATDIFLRDVIGNTTARVSLDSGGTQANGSSSNAALSANGLYVSFQSDASNLVGGDSNVSTDIFIRHRVTGITARVSVDSGGTQGLAASSGPSISADGRHVAFGSLANNLVTGDTNGSADVFVYDRQFGTIVRVSVDSLGAEGTGSSTKPSISADGRHVAFQSDAPNLVFGDTNGFIDTFVRDHGVASAFTSFCFGDGTGTACPCSNSGALGHGCENSASTGGAVLTVTGVASLDADSVQLTSSGEKPTALGIFLQGSTAVTAVKYGDGLRCVGGTLKRLRAENAVAGVAVYPDGAETPIAARSAAAGDPISLGTTRNYQVYYRDPTAIFCPTGGLFNVSNAIAIAWGP